MTRAPFGAMTSRRRSGSREPQTFGPSRPGDLARFAGGFAGRGGCAARSRSSNTHCNWVCREKSCVGLDAGDTLELAGFRVHAVPSAHEGLDTDRKGRHLYLGYVIEAEGLRLYHSGDSLAYAGLVERLGADPFDVLFLPINGRDPRGACRAT